MKPPTPRLAMVEAIEQALKLRVWGCMHRGLRVGGGELADAEDGGSRRGGGGRGMAWAAVDQRRKIFEEDGLVRRRWSAAGHGWW
jgi:hypothetical protein